MRRKFSAIAFKQELEDDSKESDEFFNSEAYKERAKRLGKLTIKLSKDGLKAVENIQEISKRLFLLQKAGIDVSALIESKRENRIKECELVFNSMNSYAQKNGLIAPLDADEFAGFYLWLFYSGDDPEFWPDRKLYYEFDSYMKDALKSTAKTRGKKFKELREIFINAEAYEECINALKIVKDPVISEDNRYLLGPKQKGAFTGWYSVVRLREKLKSGVLARDIVYCLNKEFEGLNLGADGSTLRRDTTTMADRYAKRLSKLIQ